MLNHCMLAGCRHAAGGGEVVSCDSDSSPGCSKTSLLLIAKLTKPPVKEQTPSAGINCVDQKDFCCCSCPTLKVLL